MPPSAQITVGRSSFTTTVVVDISIPSLVHILSNLNSSLAKSGTRPLSIYIANRQRDPKANSTSGVPESLVLHSVLRLLRMYMHRVRALIVHVELKSSLNEVFDALDAEGHGAVEQVILYYHVDDLV